VPASVFAKSMRDARRGLVWWSLGLVLLVATMAAVYPSIRDNPAIAKLHQDYPAAIKGFVSFGGQFDLRSPAGYLGAELFSLMVPLLLLIAAIGAASAALAGEEERGTLDLLLANPVSRMRVTLEKLAAVAAEVLSLSTVLLAACWVGSRAAGMEISFWRLLAAVADAALLALLFGALALAIGAGSGRRARAAGIAAALAVAAYVVNALSPLVGALRSARWASPFYHYAASDPLRQGLDAGHVLTLVAITAALAAAAPLLFDRRDLRA